MSDRDTRHRLPAILAADAVGYSRLVAQDDVATLATTASAARAQRDFFDKRFEPAWRALRLPE